MPRGTEGAVAEARYRAAGHYCHALPAECGKALVVADVPQCRPTVGDEVVREATEREPAGAAALVRFEVGCLVRLDDYADLFLGFADEGGHGGLVRFEMDGRQVPGPVFVARVLALPKSTSPARLMSRRCTSPVTLWRRVSGPYAGAGACVMGDLQVCQVRRDADGEYDGGHHTVADLDRRQTSENPSWAA